MLTFSYAAKHMPNRSLCMIVWSDKWPNTLTSVRKLANVVRNWPVADQVLFYIHTSAIVVLPYVLM